MRKTSFKPSPTCVVKAYRYSTIGKVECYAHVREEERYHLNGCFGSSP